MCSRYSRKNKKTKVGKKEVSIPAEPQPVIRPTDRASILRAGSSDLEVAELRWGLIPSWAQDPKIGLQCINARSETVAEKPAFRDSFLHRRCLIPADSFFEWETRGRRKIPWRFERPLELPRWPMGNLHHPHLCTQSTRRLRSQPHARTSLPRPSRTLAFEGWHFPPSPRPRRLSPQTPRRTRTTERRSLHLPVGPRSARAIPLRSPRLCGKRMVSPLRRRDAEKFSWWGTQKCHSVGPDLPKDHLFSAF